MRPHGARFSYVAWAVRKSTERGGQCLKKKEGNLEHVRKLAVQPVDQLAVQDLMKRELYLI